MSDAISFTKDAIKIVEVTSNKDSVTPNVFFDFKFSNFMIKINQI